MYYTRGELQAVPIYLDASTRVAEYHRKAASIRATVFLSHSHNDADIVNQAVQILGSQGVFVYVDWKDETMPKVTSPETASRLKTRIHQCRKFVLLATNDALESRWVPWELGVADQSNGMDNVVVLPVTDPPRTWTGSEYVGIYSTIEKSDSGVPCVFKPGQNRGVTLKHWLET